MNYTTVVFLINKNVRAICVTYDEHEKAARYTYKTLDPSIVVGDYVVVPTTTRHKMTVCKVVETDIDIDFDSAVQVKWTIDKVDHVEYESVLLQEVEAIKAIQSAEARKKREALRDALMADNLDKIKTLQIASIKGD